MMGETMVDRVARILCTLSGRDPDSKFKSSDWGPDTAPHEFAWHEFRPAALAVLEAMKDPTPEMLTESARLAGFFTDSDGLEDSYYLEVEEAKMAFNNMIRAAARG